MENEPLIGKNVMENLTEGMYDNSKIIFREYIQNSADSIDKAVKLGFDKQSLCIEILIDKANRSIVIKDNALGLSKDIFYKTLLEIANSSKDRKEDKGFRGIGRLGGLAYCKELVFKSSCCGESTCSILRWDAASMREIIHDPDQMPSAQALISSVTKREEMPCHEDTHFFEVHMIDILDEQVNKLLNKIEVKAYLKDVAPVPYSAAFLWSQKIHEFAINNEFKLDEYKILLNGTAIEKSYSGNIKSETNKTIDKITALQFEIIKTDDGTPLAWFWYGITCFSEAIKEINSMRGLRLRKENIQIGDATTLPSKGFFKEAHGNNYFVGEIFVVNPYLVPNSRRDYFNTDMHCEIFEHKLKEAIYIPLHRLYYFASNVKRACRDKIAFVEAERTHEETLFSDSTDKENRTAKLNSLKKAAEKAPNNLRLRKQEAVNTGGAFPRVYENIIKNFDKKSNISQRQEQSTPENNNSTEENHKEDGSPTDPIKSDRKTKKHYLAQELTKLSKREQKLVTFIYSVINDQLTATKANTLIRKIHEQLKIKHEQKDTIS